MPVRTATASQQANMHSRSTAGREQCAMQHMAFNKSANWVQPHQPASFAILIERKARRTYPYFPNIRVQHPCALSDYNNGATLTRTGEVHTHLFFWKLPSRYFRKLSARFNRRLRMLAVLYARNISRQTPNRPHRSQKYPKTTTRLEFRFATLDRYNNTGFRLPTLLQTARSDFFGCVHPSNLQIGEADGDASV